MKEDDVLKIKWKTQKELSKLANYDANVYSKLAHQETTELNKKIPFKYSEIKGGFVKHSEIPLYVAEK
ncbi:MAG: hypothetical protein NTV87_05725 [Ignavibacteriae bacterium]|nr:hypothetical protein [Ignavibacteriota bacterium]